MSNKSDQVDLVIKGMTRTQARVFASWYEGQGEQQQDVWFEDRNVPAPLTFVGRKGGYLEENGNTLTMFLYTPKS